jgi:hypothetical protein
MAELVVAEVVAPEELELQPVEDILVESESTTQLLELPFVTAEVVADAHITQELAGLQLVAVELGFMEMDPASIMV